MKKKKVLLLVVWALEGGIFRETERKMQGHLVYIGTVSTRVLCIVLGMAAEVWWSQSMEIPESLVEVTGFDVIIGDDSFE